MKQPITDDMARTSRGILQSAPNYSNPPPTVLRQKHSLANSLRPFSLPQAFFRPPSISSPKDYKDEVLHNGSADSSSHQFLPPSIPITHDMFFSIPITPLQLVHVLL
jgi:hypothetical protein